MERLPTLISSHKASSRKISDIEKMRGGSVRHGGDGRKERKKVEWLSTKEKKSKTGEI